VVRPEVERETHRRPVTLSEQWLDLIPVAHGSFGGGWLGAHARDARASTALSHPGVPLVCGTRDAEEPGFAGAVIVCSSRSMTCAWSPSAAGT
jgi:hypothetical protein